MSECVWSLVDELPESYRTVLALSEVESRRDAEIAMEEHCSFYRDRDSTLLCDLKVPAADS